MDRSEAQASETRPDSGDVSPRGDRNEAPGVSPEAPEKIDPAASGETGQPRDAAGRFSRQPLTKRHVQKLARIAARQAEADAFKARVLEELGGRVDASKEPLVDALCATRVRAEAFKRLGRMNKFLEENERYVRLLYLLGLARAGQHAEKPAPKEIPARDHAEWIEMRRRRKR